MNRDEAAQRAADLINEAERAMDVAMARASLLVTELPELQHRAGLNGAWAHPAVISICAALSEMTEARGMLINAHRSLSVIQRKLGVTLLEPPINGKTDDGPVIPTTGRLSAPLLPAGA